jgi:SET domain-containing protein
MNLVKKVYFDIRPSKIHGVGVFAIENIPKGTLVFKYSHIHPDTIINYPISKLITNGVTLSQIKVMKRWFAHTKDYIQIPKSFDPYTVHIVSLVNHNKNNNLVYKNGKYYAKTNIKKNTELTLDYTHKNYAAESIDF